MNGQGKAWGKGWNRGWRIWFLLLKRLNQVCFSGIVEVDTDVAFGIGIGNVGRRIE